MYEILHENLDVATSLAERHYYNGELKSSLEITEGVMKLDPYHTQCLPLHIALLVQMKKPKKLFFMAHKLVEEYPDLAVSWYAVGCYYLMQKDKHDLARRYLEKASMVNRMYGPAVLAFGHSFANASEHDQAMAAYFKASTLMPGCHLPFLYIGLEYSVTGNPKHAENFFENALVISPRDPHCLHELGVTYYMKENYGKALECFNEALDQVELIGAEITFNEWEPLLNNLGHVYRKLENYEQSLVYHRKALSIAPRSAATYSAVALAYCYLGNFKEAIVYLHRCLSLRQDDTFAGPLLENVLSQMCTDERPEDVVDNDDDEEDVCGDGTSVSPPRGGHGDHGDSRPLRFNREELVEVTSSSFSRYPQAPPSLTAPAPAPTAAPAGAAVTSCEVLGGSSMPHSTQPHSTRSHPIFIPEYYSLPQYINNNNITTQQYISNMHSTPVQLVNARLPADGSPEASNVSEAHTTLSATSATSVSNLGTSRPGEEDMDLDDMELDDSL